ncbi:MAG: Secretion system C-terminal sorting domain, partial [Bacteroidota bacterium]
GMFVLSSTDLLTDATLEIYSMDGRLVHQQDIPAYTTETSINLQNASNGLYQIRMVSGSEARSLKVVVEK